MLAPWEPLRLPRRKVGFPFSFGDSEGEGDCRMKTPTPTRTFGGLVIVGVGGEVRRRWECWCSRLGESPDEFEEVEVDEYFGLLKRSWKMQVEDRGMRTGEFVLLFVMSHQCGCVHCSSMPDAG